MQYSELLLNVGSMIDSRADQLGWIYLKLGQQTTYMSFVQSTTNHD